MKHNFNISWDLDGVLAQFDERVLEIAGHPAHVLDARGVLWPTLEKHQNFFATLQPYHDMVSLVRELNMRGVPQRIITGRPRKDGMPTATEDKIWWVKEHVGEIFDVIVCLSRDKQKHMKQGIVDVLIDDREDNIERWIKAGGVAIFHKNYDSTHSQLFKLLNE